jgi:hypothetical protein
MILFALNWVPFQFEENGVEIGYQKTIEKLNVLIKNWEEVLKFHTETTVPHNHICAQDPPNLSSIQQAQVDQWQANLCPLLGTGSGEKLCPQ